jgi:hypothetical protein
VLSEEPYAGGKLVGTLKEYFENGKLMTEVPYVDGKKEGIGKEYYDDGTQETERVFAKNKLVTLKRFDTKGSVWMEQAGEDKEHRDMDFRLPEGATQIETDTLSNVREIRRFLNQNFEKYRTEGWKTFKKDMRRKFQGGIPGERITENTDFVDKYDGTGGWYLNKRTGEIFVNVAGKDSTGTPYSKY